ncbi:hypothetical protein E2C01_097877 [Portunus trituberculatus]|uniref:Uncharacterized protein n=1 Tax=Portunus trituberculatus TaxID=210409 RepID=A0A5B7JZS1_PORTR|nr:hypothetical protein [Portunus trituberculatus]
MCTQRGMHHDRGKERQRDSGGLHTALLHGVLRLHLTCTQGEEPRLCRAVPIYPPGRWCGAAGGQSLVTANRSRQ